MRGKKAFELFQGDFIKMGRMRFYVKEMSGTGAGEKAGEKVQGDVQNLQVQAIDLSDQQCKTNSEIEEGDTCRFCLFEEVDSLEDPLLNVCDCDGSMRFIHVRCLQKWNMDKVVFKNTTSSKSYLWKSLECEICKYVYSGIFSGLS